jgi:tRNA A-37 threonylcarbamoyl transferase component Bud32
MRAHGVTERLAGSHQRRPVGEPPPLPRDLRGTTWLWVSAIAIMVAGYLWGRYGGPIGGHAQRVVDSWVMDAIEPQRQQWAGRAADDLAGAFGLATLVTLRWIVVLTMIVCKRWRQLAVFVGTVVLVNVLAGWFPLAGPEGHVAGVVGHPSLAEAGVVVTMLGVVYGVAPRGRWRRIAKGATIVIALCVGLVLLLTGQASFAEIVVAGLGAAAIGILGYRFFAPEAAFPVRYRHGRTAHLDITPERTATIERALETQLGFEVGCVEPFGLAGSGGSTPLRIHLADGTAVFGKLYATNHMRSDRWYKLGRTIMYGALEDERSFNSVRRMVEYEDHMLRYLRDHGVPSAAPLGVVELTPEREYLLVTEFVEGAHEIGDGPVDTAVIDGGLDLIRMLWDCGLAHRDIKPSNLLVRGRDVVVIDVFFCQLRPSPWRQSVDLANMMLTLALGSDPATVYASARRRFTEDEIADAFAATRGVTIPSQLRHALHEDRRDVLATFRALAPERRPIAIQRWTVRRILLTATLAAALWISLATAYGNLSPAGFGT